MTTCIQHGTWGIECGPECRRLTDVHRAESETTMSNETDTRSHITSADAQAIRRATGAMPYGAMLRQLPHAFTAADLAEYLTALGDVLRKVGEDSDRVRLERDELRRQRDAVRAFMGTAAPVTLGIGSVLAETPDHHLRKGGRPTDDRFVEFPEAYPGHIFRVVEGESGIYRNVRASGEKEAVQINHDATPWRYVEDGKTL